MLSGVRALQGRSPARWQVAAPQGGGRKLTFPPATAPEGEPATLPAGEPRRPRRKPAFPAPRTDSAGERPR